MQIEKFYKKSITPSGMKSLFVIHAVIHTTYSKFDESHGSSLHCTKEASVHGKLIIIIIILIVILPTVKKIGTI